MDDSTINDLGEPTQTLVPSWMPKPLPPRNQCSSCFAPATVNPYIIGFHHILDMNTMNPKHMDTWGIWHACISLQNNHVYIPQHANIWLSRVNLIICMFTSDRSQRRWLQTDERPSTSIGWCKSFLPRWKRSPRREREREKKLIRRMST